MTDANSSREAPEWDGDEPVDLEAYRHALLAERESRDRLQQQSIELEQQIEELQTLQEELEQTNEELHASMVELEEAREQSELATARVKAILDSLPDSVSSFDHAWRWTYLNPRARARVRALGRDPDELIGKVVWTEFPELAGTRFEKETRRALDEGKMVEYEEYFAPLGQWIEVRAVPYAEGVTSYSRDVTERRRAAEALILSERRYRALIDASTLMVWEASADGVVADLPFWREITGQRVDEVGGNGWVNAIHSDDQEATRERWAAALQTRTTFRAEYRLRLRSGTFRWFQMRGVPVLDDAGNVRQWVGIFNDIHDERREQIHSTFIAEASRMLASSLDYEATLSALADSAVPALGDWCAVDIIRDPESTRWPPTVERLAVVHRNPSKTALAMELQRRYPTDWSSNTGLPKVLREGEPQLFPEIGDELLTAVARDEEHLRILNSLGLRSAIMVPLRASGQMLGAFTLVTSESGRQYDARDLALVEDLAHRASMAIEHARLFRESRVARLEAESASRAKTEFLTTMSHELRTPLNAIDGYAELLELGIRGPLNDQQREDIARIRRSEQHLLGLINDILHLSRIEAGHERFARSRVPLRRALEEATALVEPQLIAKQMQLSLTPLDAGLAVQADAERLRQILLNLLSNAVKFTLPGGEVAITSSADGELVNIEVADTGIGIPEVERERVFEPFFQLERDRSRRSQGTGLGLAISRDLARAMGGDLTLHPRSGGGSVFVLSLPQASAGDTGERASG